MMYILAYEMPYENVMLYEYSKEVKSNMSNTSRI